MKPGKKQTRPVMELLELLGRRWTLRVLWELRDGPVGFRHLQVLCDNVPPSSLAQRLADLSAAGLVENGDAGYAYAKQGAELMRLLLPLNDWANRWAKKR